MTPENFIHLRKNILKINQQELAEHLDLHPNTISNYERDLQEVPLVTEYALYWLAAFGPGNPADEGWRPRFIGVG